MSRNTRLQWQRPARAKRAVAPNAPTSLIRLNIIYDIPAARALSLPLRPQFNGNLASFIHTHWFCVWLLRVPWRGALPSISYSWTHSIKQCKWRALSFYSYNINTLRTGDADFRLYITTVQDGWGKSAFLTRAWFPRTVHLITQYMEHFSEWSRWRMSIRGLEL